MYREFNVLKEVISIAKVYQKVYHILDMQKTTLAVGTNDPVAVLP